MIRAFDIQQSLSGRTKTTVLNHRKIVNLESNYLFQTNYWAVFIYLTNLGSKLSSHSLKLVLYVVHVLEVTKQMTELKSRRYTNLLGLVSANLDRSSDGLSPDRHPSDRHNCPSPVLLISICCDNNTHTLP